MRPSAWLLAAAAPWLRASVAACWMAGFVASTVFVCSTTFVASTGCWAGAGTAAGTGALAAFSTCGWAGAVSLTAVSTGVAALGSSLPQPVITARAAAVVRLIMEYLVFIVSV